MEIGNIRPMADEVAALMAERFGGLRRGQHADLETMLRKRGAALPRGLRREARLLAAAAGKSGQPKLARQTDLQKLEHAHKVLTGYLRPLGQGARLRGGAAAIATSVILGLLVLGAVALWIMTRHGLI